MHCTFYFAQAFTRSQVMTHCSIIHHGSALGTSFFHSWPTFSLPKLGEDFCRLYCTISPMPPATP